MLVISSHAAAGGSWFRQLSDDVEPGDRITLVGFTGGGTHTGASDDVYRGFLDLEPAHPDSGSPPANPSRLDVGEITLVPTGVPGAQQWRLHVTFTVPVDLAPGKYWFHYGANGDLAVGFGDLIGGVVTVGTPSGYRVNSADVHDATDPLVADLTARSELARTGSRPFVLVLSSLAAIGLGSVIVRIGRRV